MGIIGIIGGIAAGKSFYTDIFESLGAGIFKADEVAHDVLNLKSVKRKALERWGDGVINADGTVNRSALAKIVFQKTEDSNKERAYLESIIFPLVKRRFQNFQKKCKEKNVKYVILDAALLLESGWDAMCDSVVFVDTPESVRQQRAKLRGWTKSEFKAREAAQLSLAEKKKRAQFTLDGVAPKQDAVAAVKKLLKQLRY